MEYSENIALNKTGKAIDYTQLVFVYGNSSLVAGNMDFVPIQDSGSIAFDKLVSGDITPLICSQDISSMNDVFQWQADNNKGTTRYDCFPLSSSVLSLECADENEVAGYDILESSSVACNQDGNIHLDLKVKSLIEKDIDARVVVAAPYKIDNETYLQVLFQEYYTLGAGKVKSISEDFPNLKRVGNGKDVIIFVFSGSNAFADGATLSSVLMTNMDYYKYISRNLGPVCGVKDTENIEGKIMFAEPTRQIVDVYGNWINSKGKISASFSNINGVLPTLTVDLSKIFNNSITVSKIGNISPLSIDNNPNSSRYSSDTDVVFLKLKVTNGVYKGELKMSFSANISADIGGSKINIPYPEQKILTMSFSAEKGLIPGEYLLPLELKGFMPDEYEAKYVFN
ncbi:MAG: hypothetical protein PHO23_02775 [Candidatus Pacebacteria bacterium]|nr:hypothetical protein [Candidatus Paceibacterota bacterium]